MSPSIWPFMKRNPAAGASKSAPYHPKPVKMAPGLTTESIPSTSSSDASSSGATVSNGWSTGYDTFLSDVLVVGAGPSGLMLA